MSKLWRSVKEWSDVSRQGSQEVRRSQYSLVSTDVTPEALQLWLELPEEIKYDSTLASFRKLYEKENEKKTLPLGLKKVADTKSKRLPSVKSAPHLHNDSSTPLYLTFKGPEDVKPNGFHTQTNGIAENEQLQKDAPQKKSKFDYTRHYIKIGLLLACWIFFTIIFMMYNEKEVAIRKSSLAPGEIKRYILNISHTELSVLVDLTGPFISEQAETKLNHHQRNNSRTMEVWLERWFLRGQNLLDVIDESKHWSIVLQDDDLDFVVGESRSSRLKLQSSIWSALNRTNGYALRLKSNSNQTIPFTLSYKINPLAVNTGVLYAFLLLCGLYGLIIFEVINRTMAAVLISTLALAVLTLVGERPSLSELMSWLDAETLLLLFSMMLIVSIMAETGMFDYLAVYAFQVTKGKIWPLINLLCAVTALVSTVLDNVTTILLMAPVTIRLCEVTGLDPVPILMSMVLYSNIGGTATPVGDPPNVIIASNKAIIQSGINFTNFTVHMAFGILFVCIQTYLQLRYIHIDMKKLRRNEPRDVQDLRHQISIWRRAVASLPHLSGDEQVVKERLEQKIDKLNSQLEIILRDSTRRACSKESFQTTLEAMKAKYKIRDKQLLVKTSIATMFVVIVFFLHSIPELNRVSLAWTALLGAILLLILADREDLESVLNRVEWSTLLFFAALFVLMEALSELGLIDYIGGVTESLILKVDEQARLAVAILLLLWVSGISSAFIDNIPLTTMMVRVVTSLGNNPNLELPMAPLVWALSFGACLGGNGTLIGASANVLCAGVAEQHGYKFTFVRFFKIGFPVMLGHLVVASIYLLICHCVFTWH